VSLPVSRKTGMFNITAVLEVSAAELKQRPAAFEYSLESAQAPVVMLLIGQQFSARITCTLL